MKIKLVYIFLLFPFIMIGQIGINTTDPEETLHVNGTLRVEDTNMGNAIAILGIDSKGTLNQIDVGNNIDITNNTINITGSNFYGIIDHPISTLFPNFPFHDVDLNLNGVNNSVTVFRITGATNSFKFTGIEGGTDGKHIVLLNITSNNFSVVNEDSSSIEENRILTLGSPSESTSGTGAIELIYDGVLERWIILNIRN